MGVAGNREVALVHTGSFDSTSSGARIVATMQRGYEGRHILGVRNRGPRVPTRKSFLPARERGSEE